MRNTPTAIRSPVFEKWSPCDPNSFGPKIQKKKKKKLRPHDKVIFRAEQPPTAQNHSLCRCQDWPVPFVRSELHLGRREKFDGVRSRESILIDQVASFHPMTRGCRPHPGLSLSDLHASCPRPASAPLFFPIFLEVSPKAATRPIHDRGEVACRWVPRR